MDSAATRIQLFVNLQTILRVYRASPHTSTGETPFQLISSAPVPVMFPQLRLSRQHIQEVQRSSVPKGRLRPALQYLPGDSVLVYDTQEKVNSYGIVKQIKSNNSYMVTIGDRDKHISGDHIRLSSKEAVNDNENRNDHNLESVMEPNDDDIDCDENSDTSDSVSSISDDSDIDIPDTVNDNVTSHRTYRTESQKLHDNLSTDAPASRLRQRRN